jgi:hypothetical protein
MMSSRRERLARDFTTWIETTTLREIEMLVGVKITLQDGGTITIEPPDVLTSCPGGAN